MKIAHSIVPHRYHMPHSGLHVPVFEEGLVDGISGGCSAFLLQQVSYCVLQHRLVVSATTQITFVVWLFAVTKDVCDSG
jgi:hypothetical protein